MPYPFVLLGIATRVKKDLGRLAKDGAPPKSLRARLAVDSLKQAVS
jgi:hypothetical protein